MVKCFLCVVLVQIFMVCVCECVYVNMCVGSTPIESITRAITRLDNGMQEVQSHLQLPQHRQLPDIMQELKFDLHGTFTALYLRRRGFRCGGVIYFSAAAENL
jgi:hypothetical protein